MRKIFILFIFVILFLASTCIKALCQDSNNESALSKLNTAVSSLDITQKEFAQASKIAKPISKKIKRIIKEINDSLGFPQEGCRQKVVDALTKLNAIISSLQSKQCLEVSYRVRKTAKCIPGTVIEAFLPRFQDSLALIQEAFQIDEDKDLIPNLCDTDSQTVDIEMEIKSDAFNNNENIPVKYTCDNEDISPQLIFKSVPNNAQSLALIVDDPDAPGETFVHWVIYNLPPNIETLTEAVDKISELASGAKQGLNDFGEIGYNGPCPPSGPAHRYFFKLYALDTILNLESGVTKQQLLAEMKNHILSQAELVGKYKR